MTKFADDLYDDLMRAHGPALAATRAPVPARRPLASRRLVLAASAGGLAVAATAGSLVAVSGTPAYALTTNHDGSISLAVYREAGVAQANAKLRAIGARVIVVPAGAGCPSVGSLRKPAVPVTGPVRVQGSVSSDGSVTVNAQGVPRGDVIVVATETSGKTRETASAITSLPVPHCLSLPTPPPGSGSGHSSG
ncbi:MAG TPA: hypothetical protein VN847_27185 [Streptosporangiaceae bacterium]|nr:hypothetical protein [Streptosporangiaceae bacterium]